jgi:hypothetical protein
MSEGRHRQEDAGRRRAVAVAIVAALLVAGVGGYLLARGGGTEAAGSVSPSTTRPPTRTRSPTASTAGSVTPSVSPSASPEPADALSDGRYFVYAKTVEQNEGASSLTFDLALFLTDDAANAAAAAHGDEVPPPNGYYIVNDNPKLRTVPIDPDVAVKYFPSTGPACCTHQPGTLDGFAAAVNGTAMTHYPPMKYTPWWITLKDGAIVTITQQYLP